MSGPAHEVQGPGLRAGAEALVADLPALLVSAERLANAVQPGLHGRRRAGQGETFWQYRAAQPQDGQRGIDWRRSARGDDLFARQHEWQVAQSLQLWVDPGPGMTCGAPPKAPRAAELALALAILAERAGERIGTPGPAAPRSGRVQLGRIADQLVNGCAPLPGPGDLAAHGRAVLIGDFLGDLVPLEHCVAGAAQRGVRGVICQVLAPEEAEFSFTRRVIFDAPTGGQTHETLNAAALRPRYLERLAAQGAALEALASRTGWQFVAHRTDAPAADALLWLARAVGGGQ